MLDRVLNELGLPRIEESLSREFFYRLGLRFPQQYGIVCSDVMDCVRRAEALGVEPFVHATLSPPGWTEGGERKSCSIEVALGYVGDVELELLGRGTGTEHYARALATTDIALHHVGIYQSGVAEDANRLSAAGYPEAVRLGIRLGPALEIDVRYFDARAEHGLYIEVLDFSSFGVEVSTAPLVRGYSRLLGRLRPRLASLRSMLR